MYDVFDPCGPYILKHTISPGIFSHIIHPRHRTMVPYHKRTIPYTRYCVFPVPYRQRIPYHIRWFSHTPIYHTTNISHIPYSYRVRQSELGRRLYTRPGACYYCCSAVLLREGGDKYRVCTSSTAVRQTKERQSELAQALGSYAQCSALAAGVHTIDEKHYLRVPLLYPSRTAKHVFFFRFGRIP